MIGHYLLTLTAEQEGRVLTSMLVPTPTYIRADGCRCLIGVTMDYFGKPYSGERRVDGEVAVGVGIQFDDLCERFGTARVNAAIRNRILSNQARRTLTRQADAVPA